MIALLGLAIGFLSAGLAAVALEPASMAPGTVGEREITVIAWAFFGLAVAAGALFFVVMIYIGRCNRRKEASMAEIRALFIDGYQKRAEMMENGAAEPLGIVNLWAASVSQWLHAYDPHLEPMFLAASTGVVVAKFSARTQEETSAILHFDAHLIALTHVMREIRDAPLP